MKPEGEVLIRAQGDRYNPFLMDKCNRGYNVQQSMSLKTENILPY